MNPLLLKHNLPAVGKAVSHNPYFLVGVSVVAVPFISAIRSPSGPCTLFAINALILDDAPWRRQHARHAPVVAQERPHVAQGRREMTRSAKMGVTHDTDLFSPRPSGSVIQ